MRLLPHSSNTVNQMSTTTALQDRTELGNLPLFLPEQGAVLIGQLTSSETDEDGDAAYYIHWRGGVYRGPYQPENNSFTPRYKVDAGDRTMATQTVEFYNLEADVTLSTIGEALLRASEYSKTGVLPEKQAYVMALAEFGFNKTDIATILNVSRSTVYTQIKTAEKKAEQAEAFVSLRHEHDEDDELEAEPGASI